MSQLRFYAVIITALCFAGCEGGLLADKPPSTTLEPVPADSDTKPAVALLNTYWKLTELNGGPVQQGEGRELHMIMQGTDQVSGYAGCNQFTGSLATTETSMSIGPVAATRRMCEAVMDQEQEFLQALENASRYVISGENMRVSDAHGAITMRFIAVHMD